MNIFYLDKDPKVAAQMMCDKHIVKMILESAQLLSTCHRVQDGTEYYDKTNNGQTSAIYTNKWINKYKQLTSGLIIDEAGFGDIDRGEESE